MGGVVVVLDGRSASEKKGILKAMAARIAHRSAKGLSGLYATKRLGLAFDSSDGRQPLRNEAKNLLFAGDTQIYNAPALRIELEKAGHIFVTQSDGETILHGYEEYGTDIVLKLRGVFAFAIWDNVKNTLFAARDAFGVKPFFYTCPSVDGMIAASEIKAFLPYPDFRKELDADCLRAYLALQYVPGPSTIFKNVYQLPQGSYMQWEEGTPTVHRYWRAKFGPYADKNPERWTQEIDAAVREAVESYKGKAVKVGSFLSGGLDSSYVTTCLMPEKTFSVGYERGEDALFSESAFAQDLSGHLGTEHLRQVLSAEECFDALPEIQYHMDQPLGNPSAVPLWFLSRLAKQHVPELLSSEGADELFGGYDSYVEAPKTAQMKTLPKVLRTTLGKFAQKLPPTRASRLLVQGTGMPSKWFVGQADVFSIGEIDALLKTPYNAGPAPLDLFAPFYSRVQDEDELSQKQMMDIEYWLVGDIAAKAERMATAHGLKLHLPLLDRNLMNLAAGMPPEYRVDGTKTKVAFRRAASSALPPEWDTRPRKGFPVPIRLWIRDRRYYEWVKDYFIQDFASEFFDKKQLLRLLDEHYFRKRNTARKVWVLFSFLVWYKRFFIDEK